MIKFHRQYIAESDPMLRFRYCMCSLQYNVNTGFLQISTERHPKTLPDRKKLTTHLNSAHKMLLDSATVVRVTKHENHFCYPV